MLLVAGRLQRIGQGCWAEDGGTQQRLGHVKGLEVYRTLLTKGGRILFEVAVDFVDTHNQWQEVIRLWTITLDHDRYERELNNLAAAHQQTARATTYIRLRPMGPQNAENNLHHRRPKLFIPLDQVAGEDVPTGIPCVESTEHFPAASSAQDNISLCKMYNFSHDLLRTALRDMGDVEVDFPFRVSPAERAIIQYNPDPPCSLVLVGRSGTGKTTCAVFRIWARWLASRTSPDLFHQVFLTANPKLRSEVAKQFHKLRAATLNDAVESKRLEELSGRDYKSLADVPSEAFPVFWTTAQFLRAVDATLPDTPTRKGPFFPRLEGGELEFAEHAANEEMGGIESLLDMDVESDSDEDDGDSDGDGDVDEDGDAGRLVAEGGVGQQKKNLLGPSKEADYNCFLNDIWPVISTKEDKKALTPAMVWQEICSFLKGSSEAMQTSSGKLSLQEYLEVGRKKAPNFTPEARKQVYRIFLQYEQEKLRINRFDHLDLLFHIFGSIKARGYRGVPIHNITLDEVQDFTQADLLVDLRVLSDPNGLFCSGDPCQTIARGVSFRFADVCSLFHHEAKRRKDAGGATAATAVGVPKKPLHLGTNYRTHAGILNVAAAVVDLLREYYPMHIDNLPREKAFFKGPSPLLLSSTSPEELTFRLLGSDPNTSQVECGAHQVILARSLEDLEKLPQHLKDSDVLKLTVAQAKGLEFEDVFLWDFFNGSQADWRLLNKYVAHLQEQQDTRGHASLPAGTPLVEVEVNAQDKSALRLPREACPDVLLCEELKHLYTALTRAKNNVVVFDSNIKQRAPLFHYLLRLGLARSVTRSLMEDNTEDNHFTLKTGKNSKKDWEARGQSFLDSSHYELAAHCFKVAQDPVRQSVALAYASVRVLRNEQAKLKPKQLQQVHFKIGRDLLMAASCTDAAASPVTPAERRTWCTHAARMLQNTPAGTAFAARLYKQVGNHRNAIKAYLRCGDFVGAAESCEEELKTATGPQAQARLQDAIKYLKKAKRHLQGFQLLQKHPQIASNIASETVDELAEIAVTAHCQHGEDDKALQAAAMIRSQPRREMKLQMHGFWRELVRITKDDCKAARLLGEHGELKETITRLMSPVHRAARAGQTVSPTWADKDRLRLLHYFCSCLASQWAFEQVAIVVDCCGGHDPFNGDGYMAKGKHMARIAASNWAPAAALQQHLMAMAQYRGRQPVSRCRCIAALAACLQLVPEKDVDFPWLPVAASQLPGCKTGPLADKHQDLPEYLTWTLECCKHAQVLMEGLSSKQAAAVELHKESLREIEEYFGVKGLQTNAATVSYKRQHTNTLHKLVQAAAAAQSAGGGTSAIMVTSAAVPAATAHATSALTCDMQADRSLVTEAIAAQLLRELLPSLLKISNAAARKTLQDEQAQGSMRVGTTTCASILDTVQHVAQAMKLLDSFSKVIDASQPLKLTLAGRLPFDIHQLRLRLLASLVPLLLPLASVPDITALVVAPFRKVAEGAGISCNQELGTASVHELAVDMLRTHTVSQGSQNQNASFSSWFVLTVALQNTLQFKRELVRGSAKFLSQLPQAGVLQHAQAGQRNIPKPDVELLRCACEEFAVKRPEEACQAIMFYLERCWVLDNKHRRQPGHALALEAQLHLLEIVGASAALGLSPHSFLPGLYTDILGYSPVLGRAAQSAGSQQEGVPALKRLWLSTVPVTNTLAVMTRVVRLLYHVVNGTISRPRTFQQRAQLRHSVLPALLEPELTGDSGEEGARECAAARVALLAVTIITALHLDLHSSPRNRPHTKPLLAAAWQVVHLAEGCISGEEVLEALEGCRRAGKIADLLQALLMLTCRLKSALIQVNRVRQLPFDRLPVPTSGPRPPDSDTRHLLSVAKAVCTPDTAGRLAMLGPNVMNMLWMPVERELVTFTGSSDAAGRGTAALIIQEAYRSHLHRRLVKAKMRWLRASGLWRRIFLRGVGRARAKLQTRRAMVAMEDRRRRYQADSEQRLAWVDEALAQSLIEDSTCPVCSASPGTKAATTAPAEKRAADGRVREGQDHSNGPEPRPRAAKLLPAVADLKGALHAAHFKPHRSCQYHLEALAAFQRYKAYYREEVVTLLTAQRDVELAMHMLEEAELDAEVWNQLHEQRFKLQASHQELQGCMDLVEKERAWQDHLSRLRGPMQQHQAAVQAIKKWLASIDSKGTADEAELSPTALDKFGATRWTKATADASCSRNKPDEDQAEGLDDDYGYGELLHDKFTPVQRKKKGKRADNVPRGPAHRHL